jgi:hypothetical protein
MISKLRATNRISKKKLLRYIIITLTGFLWLWCLFFKKGILLNVSLGVLFFLVCFLGSFVHKQISLIEWRYMGLE